MLFCDGGPGNIQPSAMTLTCLITRLHLQLPNSTRCDLVWIHIGIVITSDQTTRASLHSSHALVRLSGPWPCHSPRYDPQELYYWRYCDPVIQASQSDPCPTHWRPPSVSLLLPLNTFDDEVFTGCLLYWAHQQVQSWRDNQCYSFHMSVLVMLRWTSICKPDLWCVDFSPPGVLQPRTTLKTCLVTGAGQCSGYRKRWADLTVSVHISLDLEYLFERQ